MDETAEQNSVQTGNDITSYHFSWCLFTVGQEAIEYGPLSSLLFCAYCTLAGFDWHQFPLCK